MSQPQTVLVVEDEQSIASFVSLYLKNAGYGVRAVGTGAGALNAVAAEMLLCGDDLPARRAYEVGLINYVVPDGQAVAKAREIAERIAGNGPLSVKALIATLHETESLPEAEAYDVERRRGGAGDRRGRSR